MLTYLKIKNFAIIDELEIDFNSGLNVLSGETGAGKSILIKSLQLILGGRVDVDKVRDKTKDVEIQSVFSFSQKSTVLAKLKEAGYIKEDENELIIRRTFNQTGLGKIFVDGEVISQAKLRKISGLLVDICGQHENQSLTDPHNQRESLDSYAETQKLLQDVAYIYGEIKEKEKAISNLTVDENAKQMRLNFLKYQLKELEEVNIRPEEEAELMEQSLKFEGLKEISELCQQAEQIFYGEEKSTIFPLEELRSQIRRSAKYDPSFEQKAAALDEVVDKLEALGKYFSAYARKLNVDEDTIEEVYTKIETVKKIKKKYAVQDLSQLFEKKAALKTEYGELSNQEKVIKKLNEELTKLKANYFIKANLLTEARQKGSLEMSKKVTKELQDLQMGGAKFSIEVTNVKNISVHGQDEVIYKISPNKGESLKPIDKIASGGELSRMLLALNRVLTENSFINSYIYDEIDAGIGGVAGTIVGKKLKEIATLHQVICITHLAQVAVFADTHMVISKSEAKGRVISSVNALKTDEERVQELARMLGGDLAIEESLGHARAMLTEVRKISKK